MKTLAVKPSTFLSALALASFQAIGQTADIRLDMAGPTELQDVFLPSQPFYQSYPESARVIPVNSWQLNLTTDWAAHLAQTDSFLFDGESILNTIKLRHSPWNRWELGLDIPYNVRINGVADEFIEYVETTLDAKVETRYQLPRDTYQAVLAGPAGNTLILRSASGLQDITLRGKYQVLKSDENFLKLDIASVATMSLPSGESTFGGNGFSPGIGLHFDRGFKYFHFFLGGAGNYYTDPVEQTLVYNDWRGMGYVGMAWVPARRFSMIAEYQVYTPLLPTNNPLDENSHYYSINARFGLGKRTMLEAGVVENLGVIENRNSTDVVFKFALTVQF